MDAATFDLDSCAYTAIYMYMHVPDIPHACTRYTTCMYKIYHMHVPDIPHACTRYTTCMYQIYHMHIPDIPHACTRYTTCNHSCVLRKKRQWHYPLGTAYEGYQDWSRAIFVSPSLFCASYAEEIVSENKCVLIMAWVKHGSTAHPPTTSPPHEFSKDEPQYSEFRIPVSSAEKVEDLVLRVELNSNVVVTSCMFISLSFLEDFRNEDKEIKLIELPLIISLMCMGRINCTGMQMYGTVFS